jgi:hypothetical protein
MDVLSMLTRCMQDEALRYLYVLSVQSSPGMILAGASGVGGRSAGRARGAGATPSGGRAAA